MNRYALALAGMMVAALAMPALAQNKYDPGASDTEIKIGGTAPFSGPVSVAGQLVKSVAAYFDMINAQGGINGRKINYLVEDDAFAPAKAVEMTRKLVEKDGVLFMAGSIGTPAQLAVRGYLNEHKIPQLFVTSGNPLFYDPKASPWSLGTNITNRSEGRLIGKYIEDTMPGKKVAVLYQNDDLGKEYYVGIQQTLGQKSQLVANATSEVSDPSVDSQMATLQASGADVLGLFTSSKFTAQAIRRAFDTGWKPKIIIPLISAQIDGTLRPAGLDKSVGVVADSVTMDASDPHWANNPGMIALREFQKTYNPQVTDLSYNASGYNAGYLIAEVIRRAGNDLTRANIMKQAATLDHVHPPLLVPGIDVTTTPDDFRLVHQVQFQVFTGEHWELLGTPVSD